MTRIALLGLFSCLLLAASCPSRQTSVVLENHTSFPVNVELFYDNEQLMPESLIRETGTKLTFTIAAGGVESFSRSCDDLQAIIISDADMVIAPGISPEANTRVFREPDDFTCGDTLTFTFVQDALGTDLDINYSQSSP